MPTSLKATNGFKSQAFWNQETNLERGTIHVYTPGNDFQSFPCCGCFVAPSCGTAVIEIWGAGGSDSRMCCCGGGMPGNSGAYAKKTIRMGAGCYIYFYVGMACGNADSLCYRGCSEATCLCWFGNQGLNGCMCAQGGQGGISYCSTGTSMYCCYAANSWPATNLGNGCGIVCNNCSGSYQACAYGGDINLCSRISCVVYLGCLPSCVCNINWSMAIPAGQFSKCGGYVSYTTENNQDYANWVGVGQHNHIMALNAASRWPQQGMPWAYCWGFGGGCGCYENEGCTGFIPPGHPGMGPLPCPDVRDHARKGGSGMVRIKFIPGT